MIVVQTKYSMPSVQSSPSFFYLKTNKKINGDKLAFCNIFFVKSAVFAIGNLFQNSVRDVLYELLLYCTVVLSYFRY